MFLMFIYSKGRQSLLRIILLQLSFSNGSFFLLIQGEKRAVNQLKAFIFAYVSKTKKELLKKNHYVGTCKLANI